ncbi:ABC transporter substrate-binding protein [Planktosalinus lacus]|uniref:Iron ABC transporter n=1 Tax=Planktosalinus lacus TaxID=1526573 RepID=A0A8J2V9H3_9FLAO|nr:helical backbone metal receptor [Planktosalinus lacus]GGD91738.1 iron ABC transporter [Planktosalinus lacus]
MDYFDQLKRPISLLKTPSRIVSLVPSQTELLVDLGLEENIVGITKFCVHPIHLKKQKTIVGGTKQVHFEKIKALSPDIIICNKEENTKEMVAKLETIAPVWISDIKNISNCIEMISAFGNIFSVEKKAKEINENIQKNLVSFKNSVAKSSSLKTAYLIWKDPYMAAGKNTFIDELLQLNKFENIFSSRDVRYPEITIEDLHYAELILLSTEPFPFKHIHVEHLKSELGNKKILPVDGEYFSWYGSRLLKTFDYFKKLQSKI